MQDEPLSDPPLDDVLQDFEAALCEVVPGLDVVDRGLELGGKVVEVVGVDDAGRLVLARLAEEDPDAAVLAALDVLRAAQAELGPLARHLGHAAVDSGLAPRLVLVAERIAPEVRGRLGLLGEERLLLCEVRELKSARGAATYLVPLAPDPAPARAPAGAGAERFLAALEDGQRATAGLLVRRLRRVDGEVQCAPAASGLEWRFRGATLCRLRRAAGGLEASVPPGGAPLELVGPEQVDLLLDAALRRYVALLEERSGDEESLEQVELVPADPGLVLSPEELEAFRT
jgi:hypothetical protein